MKEISATLNRSKTSVYFHIKDIPKTDVLLAKIREENNARLKKIRPNLKGISWKKRHCKQFKKWTSELVNLVAHSIFDGEVKKCSTYYHNRCVALVDNFRNKLKIIYNFKPIVRIDKKSGVIRLEYNSVELADYLVIKRAELLGKILSLNRNCQYEFLKSFFDDEGSVAFQKKINSRRIKGYQYNNDILFLVQKLLANFGIESKVDSRFHEIIIGRRENLEKFTREINFSAGLRVNGNRSNSIWKKDLEKRKILKMALASYKN